MSIFNIKYYYIIELNTHNQDILKTFPSAISDFGLHDNVIITSKEYSNYEDCIGTIGLLISDSIHLLEKTDEDITVFWERPEYVSNYDMIKEVFDNDEHDNQIEYNSYWLPDECIKMFITDKEDDSKWYFKIRVFSKDIRFILNENTTIQ